MADSIGLLMIYCGYSILWWKMLKYQRLFWRCLLGQEFLVVIIGNGETRRLNLFLVQFKLVFSQNQ